MCYFQEITLNCGHVQTTRYAYCHFARNDPVHACFGVKTLGRVWTQDDYACDACGEFGQYSRIQEGRM